jgi:hypothetical protein
MNTSNKRRTQWFSTFLHRSSSGADAAAEVKRLSTESAMLAVLTIVFLVALGWLSLRVTAMPDTVPASAPLDQFSSARALEHLLCPILPALPARRGT